MKIFSQLLCVSVSLLLYACSSSEFETVAVPSDLSFNCGEQATCNPFNPICEISTGGADPELPNYSCQAVAEECLQSYTCECLTASSRFTDYTCQGSASEGITLSIQYP